MNTIKKLLLSLILLLPILLFSTTTDIDNKLAIFYTIDGNVEKEYNELVEKKLSAIGYKLTNSHKRINDKFEVKYGSTVLDVLSFMPVTNNAVILPLLNIDPRLAGFAPFNMLIHKRLDEKVTHVGHLMPKVMLDILGIENEEVRRKFSTTFKSLDATMAQSMGGKQSFITYKKLPEQKMINFEYTFEEPKDIEDFISKFQDKFELAFIDKGYLIAGYNNLMESTKNASKILSSYDAFWTYSLAHLEFSYTMFDNEGARPEAGLFAPSTMYMYIKKGSNKLVLGMFRLHNWSDTLDISDPKRLSLVEKLDNEIPEILTAFGMKATENTKPLATPATVSKESKKIMPVVKEKPMAKKPITEPIKEIKTVEPKAKIVKEIVANKEEVAETKAKSTKSQTIETGSGSIKIVLPTVPKPIEAIKFKNNTNDRSIKFSKRVPPNYIAHRFDHKKKAKVSANTRIGEVNQGRISAYLRGEFMEAKALEDKLKAAGFEVLSTAPINKKGDLISIVFTNKDIVGMASKAKRGFMGALRALVDTKEKSISITNPLYMAKGFMQEDFDEKSAKKILVNLLIEFPNLKNAKDALKFQLLSKYQFMNGMPKYENMIEVAAGADLLERLKDNKKVVFTQKLDNGSTLIGIQLAKRTRKFTKRIGRNNAAMLPYPVLIEDGKAMILDPKFYISFMYPLLQMSEFMTIATIPDAMIKDCEKVFRKK